MIEQKVADFKSKVKFQLNHVKWFSLTSDIWSDTINTRSFISLTCHFINEGIFKSLILAVRKMNLNHEAVNIATELTEILWEYNICFDKIVCITTDNGRNMVLASEQLLGIDSHIKCFAYSLNLITQYSIECDVSVKNTIEKVKQIVSKFKYSIKLNEELKKSQCQSQFNDGTSLKLIQAIETRRNSVYLMIERFIKLKEYISTALLRNKSTVNMLSTEEIVILEQFLIVLKPTYDVTIEISAEKQTTISKIVPIYACLTHFYNESKFESRLAMKLKNAIQHKIKERFKAYEQEDLYGFSMILDPRFKKIHFSNRNIANKMVKKLNLLVENEISLSQTSQAPTTTTDTSIWSFHDKIVSNIDVELESISNELKRYLNEPTINRSADPLIFWLNNKNNFGHLHDYAIKYLTAIATSVPSERVFSKAEHVLNKRRANLTGKHAEGLIFLNQFSIENWNEFNMSNKKD